MNTSSKGLNQSHLPILERSYPHIIGTIMAFDFGEKRIGVATGESMLKTAHALLTIDTPLNDVRFTQIAALIQEWRPALLVVGLPQHMNGDAHLLTSLSKKFAQRLEGRFNLPVVMQDERLTSFDAAQQLAAAGVKNAKQKNVLDAVAAQSILQSYFDQSP